jgi:hypothetical protein
MGFELKKDWPIVAAGGLGVVALMAFKGGGAGGYSLAGGGVDPGAAADYQTASQAASANADRAAGLVGQYLSYLATLKGYDAANYQSFVGGSVHSFDTATQAEVYDAATRAQLQVGLANAPSGWQKFLNGVGNAANGIANAISAYYTGATAFRNSGYGGSGGYGGGYYPPGTPLGSLPSMGQSYGAGTLTPPVPTTSYGGP